MNILEDYYVDCSIVFFEKEDTSYSVILAVPGIDRIFLHNVLLYSRKTGAH